jgi:hypothetical protein
MSACMAQRTRDKDDGIPTKYVTEDNLFPFSKLKLNAQLKLNALQCHHGSEDITIQIRENPSK